MIDVNVYITLNGTKPAKGVTCRLITAVTKTAVDPVWQDKQYKISLMLFISKLMAIKQYQSVKLIPNHANGRDMTDHFQLKQ